MYTEKQYFQNRYARWFQWSCALVALVQLFFLIAAETGYAWLPLGYVAHWVFAIAPGLLFILLVRSGLVLRIDKQGMSLRYSPYQTRFQDIGWDEIRQLRLLPAGGYPKGVRLGMPAHDLTHAYWLSNPDYAILHILLMNGNQLYVSTQRPEELLDYLQHGLHTHSVKIH